MYIPPHFAETRLDVLHDFILKHPFATLVSTTPNGPVASHIPVILHPTAGPHGALHFHLARPNEHCQHLASGAPTLAIFHGPHGYISPTWYESRAAVPTWNYVVVHAHGTPGALSEAHLRDHLRALTRIFEGADRDSWDIDRLPPDFLDKHQRAIQGFEMPIAKIEGKWKLGQNRSPADRQGAINKLRESEDADAIRLAAWMTSTMPDIPPDQV